MKQRDRRVIAVTSFTAITVASVLPAFADSMAGFQAGSMAGSMNDTQSTSENNSHANSSNNSQSANQQNSHAGTENSSQARIESAGGPLTNSKPGCMVPADQNNTGDRSVAGNKPGMVGRQSMTLPEPPPDVSSRPAEVAKAPRRPAPHVVTRTYRWLTRHR